MPKTKLIYRLTLWRIRNSIGDRNFIMIISLFVGFCAGLAAVVIKNSVHYINSLLEFLLSVKHGNYLYVVFPIIGIFLTLLFYIKIFKARLGHGIPEVLYSISRNKSILPRHSMFLSIIGSALTVGFGGSAGLEGPSVSTGSGLGSNIGRMLRLNHKQLTLLIGCASAGAISAIFKAPVAGVVFSLEILMLDLTMSSIVPLLIASVVGTLTSFLFFGQNVIYHFEPEYGFHMSDLFAYILLGILCGLTSVYFTNVHFYIHKTFKKIKSRFVRLAVCGILLGGLILLFPPLFGEGYNEINSCLKGDFSFLFDNSFFSGYEQNTLILLIILLALVLLKVVAMSLTFSAGGVGGIFAPSLYTGASLGILFSSTSEYLGFKHLPASNFALVGMAGIMAGVMHAPLTSIFLIAEISGGYELLVPLMITATISYLTIKYYKPYSINALQLAEKGELITHNKDKSALSRMNVSELIENNFNSIDPDATLGDLVKVISVSSRNIFPVVDDENNFMGMVVMSDVRKIVFNVELYKTIYVHELMIMPETIVDPGESMEEIAAKFEHSSYYNLPVLENGKYLGFVSRANVFSKYRTFIKSFSEE